MTRGWVTRDSVLRDSVLLAGRLLPSHESRTPLMRLLVLPLVLLAACAAEPEAPAEAPPAPEPAAAPAADAPPDTSITAFFSRFQAAVRQNDAAAVADLMVFPLEYANLGRAQFLDETYPVVLSEGAFRTRLLAASPAALEAQGDGYAYQTVVDFCEGEETACESSAVFRFGRDAQGRWRVVDLLLAG